MNWHINQVFKKADNLTYMQLFVYEDIPCPDCARMPRRAHPPTDGPCPGMVQQPLAALDVPIPENADMATVQPLVDKELQKLLDLKKRGKLGAPIEPTQVDSALMGQRG